MSREYGRMMAVLVLLGSGLVAMADGDATNAPAAPAKPVEQAVLSWFERMTVGGEFRLRHQAQSEEGLPERVRERYRARLNIEGKVNDQVKVGMRLVSNVGGDPISDNQTMTGSFSDKALALDRAYLKVTPVAGVTFVGGKVAQPWYSVSDLAFSEDVNPEGFAVSCSRDFGSASVFGHAGYWVLEERKTDDDSTMVSGQIGATLKPMKWLKATIGASVYAYGTVEGRPLFFNVTDAAGNSTTTNRISETTTEQRYLYGYNEIEGFFKAEADLRVPVAIGAQYVENTKVDDNGVAYMGQIAVGKVKQPGSVEVGYQYRYIENDAILGVFAENADTARGTGVKAHVPYIKYRLWKDFDVKVVYADAKKGLENGVDVGIFRVDLLLKF